ncbi:IS200/IS605 family transposase [Verrucomicrobium sp. BvORR106]|uniref:IS200/IS605 family transposase n=1 Tax=Verrucomicrobium sp. BvORR106 TaxID=1403819 RepID=UPI00056FAEC8|nr:IS200/IS605 family transposase [Verrucomicrobium sp. BvORR106]
MPGTFTSLHYHLVFSTKNRERCISREWMARLHEYLGGTVHGLGGIPEGIGGVADHVHLLVGLKATHCLSDFMRDLKRASSIWVHQEMGIRDFSWQEGYAAFSISATSREPVLKYIAQQEDHHRTRSFREELAQMLVKAGVRFEDRFLD